MRRHAPLLAFALLILSAPGRADEPEAAKPAADEPPPEVKAYIDFIDKHRSVSIGDLKGRLKHVNAKERAQLKKTIREIEAGEDYLPTGQLNLPLKEGEFGHLNDSVGKVVQIMEGQDAALVSVTFALSEKLVWIDGIDATKHTDGDVIRFGDVFRVLGNKQYASVTGATQTVLHIKAFDLGELAEWRKDHPPKKNKPKKR